MSQCLLREGGDLTLSAYSVEELGFASRAETQLQPLNEARADVSLLRARV